MDIKITDNSSQFLEALLVQTKIGLESIGAQAETYAKENCPVDTGRLRNSISHVVIDDAAYIGTNVEYAPQVEFRDMAHRNGSAHFLRDSATTHNDEYKSIMESALKS